MRMIVRKTITFATLLLMSVCMAFPAFATLVPQTQEDAAIQIDEIATEIGDNYVRYPQLSGMADAAVQQAVNDDIVNEAKIAQRLITLSTGASLQVDSKPYLKNHLFSIVISAKGIMENFRKGHEYTALAYDLNTGTRVQLGDIFTDPDAAITWMEDQLLSGYADELSIYLEYAELTPLPAQSFAFDENGLTFFYPSDQFLLLNGYSGAVQFQYGELQDFLIADPGGVPARLDIVQPAYTDAQIKANIEAAAADGALPDIPVRLDDSIPALIDMYRLVRKPDLSPNGRYFQLEDPAFRGVIVLSDALTSSYDNSTVEGILAMRLNFYGLRTGVTTRDRWLDMLGEPSPSVFLEASYAADYGLPVGTADYYTVSGRQLMLYSDTNDVLYAVRLTTK